MSGFYHFKAEEMGILAWPAAFATHVAWPRRRRCRSSGQPKLERRVGPLNRMRTADIAAPSVEGKASEPRKGGTRQVAKVPKERPPNAVAAWERIDIFAVHFTTSAGTC